MKITYLLLPAWLLLSVPQWALAANPMIKDLFDRDITQRGITLVDWEGYMGNPAIAVDVVPPSDAAFPVQATVTANESQLYFDLPSDAGAQGPCKQLTFSGNEPTRFSMAVFPFRIKRKRDAVLQIQFTDTMSRQWQLNVPIHVTFTDHAGDGETRPAAGSPVASRPAAKPDIYPITVDFSQDKTGFFKDAARRKVVEKAAADWAFYFAAIPLNEVRAHSEKTLIFEPSGFTKHNLVTNKKAYTGYLLYAYGIDGPETEIRSGGEPSRKGALQQSAGKQLSIHRSGGFEAEIKGNYNKLRWNTSFKDEDWWRATNLGDVQNDFYSIAHHEIGHSLIFNPNNPKFKSNAVIADDAVRAYLGYDAKTDTHDHLDGIVDPTSLRGAFGNEYHGKTPLGRWLITKLDLLTAQAVGYKLREVDALAPLAIQSDSAPATATVGKAFAMALRALGGMPFYDWSISDGKLPVGLELDRFTGEIAGTPTQAGASTFTVSLRDYTRDGKAVSRQVTLSVNP